MKMAEKAIKLSSTKNYAWSPKLRNAAITKRCWKLRLREEKNDKEDYTQTIRRLQENIQQQEAGFQFPYQHTKLNMEEVKKHLKQLGKDLL